MKYIKVSLPNKMSSIYNKFENTNSMPFIQLFASIQQIFDIFLISSWIIVIQKNSCECQILVLTYHEFALHLLDAHLLAISCDVNGFNGNQEKVWGLQLQYEND